MFDELKSMLLKEPEHIVELLDFYSFYKITSNQREIRCAFESGGNPTSVVIRLIDNDKLFVKDYGRNLSNDLMGYISKVREVPLKNVLQKIKSLLGIDSFYFNAPKKNLFGGIFEDIGKTYVEKQVPVISESVLNKYMKSYSERFLDDGISFETQKKFGIGFCVEEQRITIPIRNEFGELIGIKGRCNYTPDEFEPKYLYIEPCLMSQTLYGFSENYSNMQCNDVFVFESEKSVMQADTMGFNNAVALGSNSLSDKQAKMIVSLQPKRVVFALDNSLKLENTFINIKKLKEWDSFNSISISYFDWTNCNLLDEKDSPTDKGAFVFKEITERYLKDFAVGS